jgi:hypothetical protein
VKILSRRKEPAQNEDVNGDGRVDGRDGDGATYRSTATGDGRDSDAERRAADRAATARAATVRPVATETPQAGAVTPDPVQERTVDLDRGRSVPRPVPVDGEHADLDGRAERVAVGPKPRASLLATLGLIVSVVGALFVLTGTLAGYGIAVGAAGAVLSVLGLMATRRRHVAGKTDALIGILLGLAAVVVGVVAMTGQFDWPTADGDWVSRFREWLDSQFVDRF